MPSCQLGEATLQVTPMPEISVTKHSKTGGGDDDVWTAGERIDRSSMAYPALS